MKLFGWFLMLISPAVWAVQHVDTFDQQTPVSDFIGITQQGDNAGQFYTSCDQYQKDCPQHTYKHRDLRRKAPKQEQIRLKGES